MYKNIYKYIYIYIYMLYIYIYYLRHVLKCMNSHRVIVVITRMAYFSMILFLCFTNLASARFDYCVFWIIYAYAYIYISIYIRYIYIINIYIFIYMYYIQHIYIYIYIYLYIYIHTDNNFCYSMIYFENIYSKKNGQI